MFPASCTVVYAKVVLDPDLLRREDRFGVVEMDTTQGARDAIRALNNSEFRGHTLIVRAATADEETAAGHPRMFTSMNMSDDDDRDDGHHTRRKSHDHNTRMVLVRDGTSPGQLALPQTRRRHGERDANESR